MMQSTINLPNIIAIVPAAGIGSRMMMGFPKQYISIGNKTLIEHSIYALLQQPCIQRVVVAISHKDIWFHGLPIAADHRVTTVYGGNSRAKSVMAGLAHANQTNNKWVLIHDAVRPCLHQDDLLRILEITYHSNIGGLLATPVRDTIKQANSSSKTIDYTVGRIRLWHALTPQVFPMPLLIYCLNRALSKNVTITDEASALEHCGYSPLLIPGRADNIKVTYQEDLLLISSIFLK